MSKHTPGPWKISKADNGGFLITSDDAYIAKIVPFPGRRGDDGEVDGGAAHSPEAEVNARNVAALPELIAALKEVAAIPVGFADTGCLVIFPRYADQALAAFDAAKRALAKAEGQ